MTTIEGNKLIAEFMEYPILTKKEYGIFCGCPEEEWDNMPESNLFYHSSWDWLMPVVEKIGTIKPIELHFSVAPSCQILKAGIKHAWEETPFKNIWLSCVEFIEWYNKQK